MPHPKDFIQDSEPLDKLNSRFFRTSLFAHCRSDGENIVYKSTWDIKLGNHYMWKCYEYKITGQFCLWPANDDGSGNDVLYGVEGITSIDDVLDYLQKRMSI